MLRISGLIARCITLSLLAGVVSTATAAELFRLSEVELLDGPFLDATRRNRDHLLRYNPDRLLAPFLREAGLAPKAAGYPNWESTGLDGHTAGHYLTALAQTVAAIGDEECDQRLRYMVAELARCQAAGDGGYVGGVPGGERIWREVAQGNIRASGFGLNGGWVPLYNLHKTLAGLRDAYLIGGVDEARPLLIGFADWFDDLVADLSDRQVQDMLRSEHGGINEVLADVAEITEDESYLKLAERFSHRAILDPLAKKLDRLNGLHANTQVPKVIGFLRIADLGGDQRGVVAAETFWRAVVNERSLAFGGNSISEHFPAPGQSIGWITNREGPETCNTYNMLRLTEGLFCREPQARYADFYERAMLNHILSSQHPEHGGYVYFTPARPRHYRVYSQPEQAFWCCVGSGMESHGKYGRFIYAHSGDDLTVNLFLASRLNWQEKGLRVTQETRFPEEGATRLRFELNEPQRFVTRVRCPSWTQASGFAVSVNGVSQSVEATPGSYVALDREWRDGDVVEVKLPMEISAEPLPHLKDYVALLHGPVVLAAKTGDDDLDGLLAGAERMDHVAHGALRPIDEAPMLVASSGTLADRLEPIPGKPLHFRAAGAIQPDRFDDLLLEPFYGVHDARYMLYWRLSDPEEYRRVREQIEAEERQRLALDRATIDRVAPGEQQPETEHNFRGEGTEAGVWQDRRFRHASGWFSYDLDTNGADEADLRVMYFGSDRRRFTIRGNGEVLAEVELSADSPGEFISRRYAIPAEILSAASGSLTIRFEAATNSMAGGVFDVRLTRPMPPRSSRQGE